MHDFLSCCATYAADKVLHITTIFVMPAAKKPRLAGDRDSDKVILSPTSSSSSSPSSTSSSSATATSTPTPFLDDVKSVARDRLQMRLSITERLEHICRELLELSSSDATVYSAEYLKFMHLKADHDVQGERSILAPSPAVDELWHKHLLDTVSYKCWRICCYQMVVLFTIIHL